MDTKTGWRSRYYDEIYIQFVRRLYQNDGADIDELAAGQMNEDMDGVLDGITEECISGGVIGLTKEM
jgi:hypothetical protein